MGVPGWSDPAATAATVIDGSPASVLAALRSEIAGPAPAGTGSNGGGRPRRRAATAVASALAQESTPNEPAIARDVVAALPDGRPAGGGVVDADP